MWQPIETAPTDGTVVLVCHKNNYNYAPEAAFFGTYSPDSLGKKTWRSVNSSTKIMVTHWMPNLVKPE